jgi:hypothetical protein
MNSYAIGTKKLAVNGSIQYIWNISAAGIPDSRDLIYIYT